LDRRARGRADVRGESEIPKAAVRQAERSRGIKSRDRPCNPFPLIPLSVFIIQSVISHRSLARSLARWSSEIRRTCRPICSRANIEFAGYNPGKSSEAHEILTNPSCCTHMCNGICNLVYTCADRPTYSRTRSSRGETSSLRVFRAFS